MYGGEDTRWRRNRIKSTHSIYRTLYECTNTSTAPETQCVHDKTVCRERDTGINAFHSNSAQSLWLMIRLSSATDHTAVSIWLCACGTNVYAVCMDAIPFCLCYTYNQWNFLFAAAVVVLLKIRCSIRRTTFLVFLFDYHIACYHRFGLKLFFLKMFCGHALLQFAVQMQ